MDALVIADVVAALAALNAGARVSERKNPSRKRRPSVARPVKRFKKKTRGWHLKPKTYAVSTTTSRVDITGVDHKNWVRLYPNPGYRINGWHWCRGTHKRRIRWED